MRRVCPRVPGVRGRDLGSQPQIVAGKPIRDEIILLGVPRGVGRFKGTHCGGTVVANGARPEQHLACEDGPKNRVKNNYGMAWLVDNE